MAYQTMNIRWIIVIARLVHLDRLLLAMVFDRFLLVLTVFSSFFFFSVTFGTARGSVSTFGTFISDVEFDILKNLGWKSFICSNISGFSVNVADNKSFCIGSSLVLLKIRL
jgi:hypothetical protein